MRADDYMMYKNSGVSRCLMKVRKFLKESSNMFVMQAGCRLLNSFLLSNATPVLAMMSPVTHWVISWNLETSTNLQSAQDLWKNQSEFSSNGHPNQVRAGPLADFSWGEGATPRHHDTDHHVEVEAPGIDNLPAKSMFLPFWFGVKNLWQMIFSALGWIHLSGLPSDSPMKGKITECTSVTCKSGIFIWSLAAKNQPPSQQRNTQPLRIHHGT